MTKKKRKDNKETAHRLVDAHLQQGARGRQVAVARVVQQDEDGVGLPRRRHGGHHHQQQQQQPPQQRAHHVRRSTEKIERKEGKKKKKRRSI